MALIKCKECNGQISSKAKQCPHCGVKVRRTTMFTWIVAILGAYIVVSCNLNSYENSSNKNISTPSVSQNSARVAKKDGTFDARENDLDELCKDWVYYKAKSYKYGREGDQEAAADARNSFQAVNRSLSEYPDDVVARTCAKYDTEENLSKYMR